MYTYNTIALRSVWKSYTSSFGATVQLLQDATYAFKQGISYGITGPSGSGKSTLLHLLSGLDAPDSGAALYNEVEISKLAQKEKEIFLLKKIGFVFQYPYLIHELTVLENIMLKGLIAQADMDYCYERAQELIRSIDLRDKENQPSAVLSGGEKQRVALARALFFKPEFLLADEPTAHLDEHASKEIISLLQDMQKEHHMALVIATHDPYVLQHMNEIYSLKKENMQET